MVLVVVMPLSLSGVVRSIRDVTRNCVAASNPKAGECVERSKRKKKKSIHYFVIKEKHSFLS